jgi:hypothetical protein
VEAENNIQLDPSDYDFENPLPASPPEGSTASYNSKITLTANNPAAPYVGSVDIYYNRLDIADLDVLADIYVQAPTLNTTHDVIDSLNRRYGLNFAPSDLVDHPVVDNTTYKTVTLEATPGSLGWIGQLDINATEGDLVLEEHVLTTTLGGLNYPTESTDRVFAHFYSFWQDFTDHHETLKTIQTGDPIGLELVTVLDDVTGDPWLGSGPSDYSLKDAQIVFSGSTYDYPNTNDDYPMVIVVRLDPTQCLALDGDLVIHHGPDPHATLGY